MEKSKSKTTRDSNYELMRIISMLMIVIWHILTHGQVVTGMTGISATIMKLLQTIIVIHVDSFILVTGYYQCKNKFNFKKAISLNNQSWFYRVVILFIMLGFDWIQVGKVELFQMVFPLDFDAYWFVKMYLFLYCLSPFINKLLKNLEKAQFQKLLITLFIILSVLPTFSMQTLYSDAGGYSLPFFVLLYLLGAYFRYYPIQKSRILKVNTEHKNQLLFLIIFIFLFTFNFLFHQFGTQLVAYNGELTKYFGDVITLDTFNYDNSFVLLGALFYFFYFGTLHFQSNMINHISSLTLGVYLIHDNPYIRQKLYPLLGFSEGNTYSGLKIFVKIFACALIIFIVCAIIEWIRQLLFKGIKHLKITKWIQNKWYHYIASLNSSKIEELE
ncbi:MAG: acyltransferase [Firmicutes bacterium]|nr:acyltransferase [Bacillota bacterium]